MPSDRLSSERLSSDRLSSERPSSDFATSLKKFAEATAGTLLPIEALDARARERARATLDHKRRAARRANPIATATGRLVFAATAEQPEPRPLPHMTVQLWDRDPLGTDDWLGEGTSDAEGYFTISYDPADAGRLDRPDLELRVIDHYADRDEVLCIVEGRDNTTEVESDFGVVPVPFYEYHPDLPLPHVRTFTLDQHTMDGLPQRYAVGRKLALARTARKVLGVRLKHYTVDRETRLEDIQADYAGLTSYQRPARPSSTATDDERFVYKLLNGACPTDFTTTPDGRLHVVRSWDRFALDGVHELPNIHAVFARENDRLVPLSITVQLRTDNASAPHSPLDPPQVYRPGERGWSHAKHLLESNNYVYTQVANHLGRGHFNAEQLALAAWRNLRLSPLRRILFPHLREVMIINVEGESAIFGPDGLVTKNSALTADSLAEAIVAHSSIDWWGWRPRAPVAADHDYARIAQLVWEAISEHIDQALAAEMDGIVAAWGEVLGMSEDLVSHSIAFEPWPLPEGHALLDPREHAKPDAPRVERGGVVRTMSPITTSAQPRAADIENLAQFCRYALFHAGFWHGWVNDTTDALEDSYAQYNPIASSTPRELTNHISLNLALSQTRYGLVLADEDGDVPESYKAAVRKRAEALAELGYDVRRLRSRINI
jgi:hypothetical protein